jgi:hypothetical protein
VRSIIKAAACALSTAFVDSPRMVKRRIQLTAKGEGKSNSNSDEAKRQ